MVTKVRPCATGSLLKLFSVNQFEEYQQIHKGWIEDILKSEEDKRIPAWTQNIAVGSQDYLTRVKSALGLAGRYKAMVTEGDVHSLKEHITPYTVDLVAKKKALSDKNTIILK